MKAEQDNRNQPLRDRIAIIDDLLDNHNQQLERLLDLYLTGDVTRDLLIDRKTRTEETIIALQTEKTRLEATVEAHTLNAGELEDLHALARNLALGLQETKQHDFGTQRWILEKLSLRGMPFISEGGDKKIKVECSFGPDVLLDVSSSTHNIARYNLHPASA